MQKYHKFLVFLLLATAAASIAGCSVSEKGNDAASGLQSGSVQTDHIQTNSAQTNDEPARMILVNNICYYDAGRSVFNSPDHTDGTIQSVTASQDAQPQNNEEANFDCLGASYCILADGAAAVMTDEGTYELFLADDTVEFQGVCKKKNALSSDTLKWLNFYYSLSESDRNALSMIPSEFAGQVSGSGMTVNETSASNTSYLEALTQEELDTTEALAQYYFTEEVTSFEGVDQIYPADSSDPQYHNSGIEDDYGPGNIIIYRVLTNLDRRDGNPFRYISIARKSKSDDWKIINSGF